MGSNQSKSALAAVASVANKKAQSPHANLNNKNHSPQKTLQDTKPLDNNLHKATPIPALQNNAIQASSQQQNLNQQDKHDKKENHSSESSLKSSSDITQTVQKMARSAHNNAMLELNHNMVHLLREGISNIHSHSEKFLNEMQQHRLEKQNCFNEMHHATIDGFHTISQTYLDAAQSSLSCIKEKNPVSLIETQMQTASKLSQAYSNIFTSIRNTSVKAMCHNMNSFYKTRK